MTGSLDELPTLLSDLYRIVERLETMAPGRKFTPDGHLVGSIGEAVAAYAYGLELLPASVRQHDARTVDGKHVQIKLTQGQAVALSYDCEHLLVLQLDRKKGFLEVYNGPGTPVWLMIEGKQDVGRQRQIRVSRLKQIITDQALSLPQVRPFPTVLPKALEAAGVEFIAENDRNDGMQLRVAASPGDTLAPPSFASTIATALDAMPGKAAEGRGSADSASGDQPNNAAQGSGRRQEK